MLEIPPSGGKNSYSLLKQELQTVILLVSMEIPKEPIFTCGSKIFENFSNDMRSMQI
jgi:hypothetical protein